MQRKRQVTHGKRPAQTWIQQHGSLAGRAQTDFSKGKGNCPGLRTVVGCHETVIPPATRGDSHSGQKPPDLNETVSPRLEDLNSWSQLLALFGAVMEPLRCRNLLEKARPLTEALRVLPCPTYSSLFAEVEDSPSCSSYRLPLPPAPLWTLP